MGRRGAGEGGQGCPGGPPPPPPTSIFELNMVLKFQFRTSGILLFTDVQKLYGLEILQFLLCICGQFMDYLWTIFGQFIFSNYIGEIDHFALDLLKRSDT